MRRDLSGLVFGRLTAVFVVSKDRSGSSLWHCECSCGGVSTVRASNLTQGVTNSCGCLRIEAKRAELIKSRGSNGRKQKRAA